MKIERIPELYNPENVRSWRITKAVVYALIAVAAVAWLAVDQYRAAAQKALVKTGQTMKGRITDLPAGRGDQTLTISYSFSVEGSDYPVLHRRVGDFEGLAPNGPVTVWYDPVDPHRCVTHNELTHARFGWTPFLFGGLIVVMMGLAGYQAYQVIQPARDSALGE